MESNKMFYNQVLTEHNMNPLNKGKLESANMVLEGVNPSCGDDIVLQLNVKDGVIEDGMFSGSGCAVSQASVDIMLDMIIGRSTEDALRLCELFMKMIRGEASEEELSELSEAAALKDISHMPARVKCAVLGWHTLEELLSKKKDA